MARVFTSGLMVGNTKVNISTIKSTDLAPILTPTEDPIGVNGHLVNSTAKAFLLRLKEHKEKVFGKKVRESIG